LYAIQWEIVRGARARKDRIVGSIVVYSYGAKHTPPTAVVSTLLYRREKKRERGMGLWVLS
jgi:hypothetical protein